MMESLNLHNFTAFSDGNFEFAGGLNVLVGENGTGKTHVLKAAYSLVKVRSIAASGAAPADSIKSHFFWAISEKLRGVFKPLSLVALARHGQQSFAIRAAFQPLSDDNVLEFSFPAPSGDFPKAPSDDMWQDLISAGGYVSRELLQAAPVYLPTRELLSIYPGFVSLYETTHLPFEETWRDTCVLLGAPLARGRRERTIRELLAPLEEAMSGRVELDEAGRFYLDSNGVKTEMHLVAEGYRKLAMIARLIATGALVDKGYLFWDEPESNLNPKAIKLVAKTILHLCRGGIQVFIATHSLFLLRELEILRHQAPFHEVPARFFGLHQRGKGIEVQQGGGIEDIGDIDALQEELSQSDRYLEAEAR